MYLNSTELTGTSVLEIELENEQEARVLFDALFPETQSVPSDRAETNVSVDGHLLRIEIRASDLTALRAAMNSFLAWVSACKRTLDSMV